ncbi:hypothetical protein ACQJ0O_19060 [Pseudomonas shirazensis]|uniref:hypothetical protein n=1 Tax=Pseudomonas shirazensis TaxID=2745494 RepID=UPI003CFC36BC
MPYEVKIVFSTILLFSTFAQSAPNPLRIIATPELSQTVFSWQHDRCFDTHIPDSPARAFRSSSGTVYLYATHYTNIPLAGTSIDHVKPECEINFQGANSTDPSTYNTRIWLQTFFSTNSGKDVYSLGSSDYHGKWFNNCDLKTITSSDCWQSAIVLAHSSDGGKTFVIAHPPKHVIANSSQRYSPTQKGSVGFLTTSNIVKINNYFYSLFYASADKSQDSGNCLARTGDLSDPRSWRAWNGQSFEVPLYHKETKNLEITTCRKILSLPFKVRSLLWHAESDGYIAVFEQTRSLTDPERRTDVTFAYSWSSNLKDWSQPTKIITLMGNSNCKRPIVPGAYPSLIDSSSLDENFGSVGGNAYLYYTKFNLQANCHLTLDRDLVRMPVRIHSK